MLTGKAPFQAESTEEALALARENQFEPLATTGADAPAHLKRLCEKCMAGDPTDRFANATEVLQQTARSTRQPKIVVAAACALAMLIAICWAALPPRTTTVTGGGGLEEYASNALAETLTRASPSDSAGVKLAFRSGANTTDLASIPKDDFGRVLFRPGEVEIVAESQRRCWVGLISMNRTGQKWAPVRLHYAAVEPGQPATVSVQLSVSEGGDTEYLLVLSATKPWDFQEVIDRLSSVEVEPKRSIRPMADYWVKALEYIVREIPDTHAPQAQFTVQDDVPTSPYVAARQVIKCLQDEDTEALHKLRKHCASASW